MKSAGQVARLALAGALIAATATIGSMPTDAHSVLTSPFTLEVFDTDDGSALDLSADGKFLYAGFEGLPMRVDIEGSTSEVAGGFGDGVLSGRTAFVDSATTGDTFTRLYWSGGSTSIDRLPWVEPGSAVLAADGFGRFVIPDAEPGIIHDTRTGLIWGPSPTFSRVLPAGPNSLSADGNTALFMEQCLRACPPGFSTFNRSTGELRFVETQFVSGTPEAAISANARYVVVPASDGFSRVDLATDTRQFVRFDGRTGAPTSTPTQIAVGNDGQVFFVSGGHAYRWLASTGSIAQIDVSSSGEPADAPVTTLRVSADGARIAFTSTATNLAPSWGCCGSDNVYTYVGTARPATGHVRSVSRLDAVDVHPKMAAISWSASRTSSATGYAILRNGVEIAQTIGTDISLEGLPSGNNYFQVQAFAPSQGEDGGLRRSWRTSPTKLKTDYDGSRPTFPTDLVAEFNSDPRQQTFDLTWTPSRDNSNVVRYAIYDRNVLVTMVDGPSARLALPVPSTHYFQVRAFDLNGNQSVKTPPVFAQT